MRSILNQHRRQWTYDQTTETRNTSEIGGGVVTPLEALPTITSTDELNGYLAAGVEMKAEYTAEEQQAIARKKVELLKESK